MPSSLSTWVSTLVKVTSGCAAWIFASRSATSRSTVTSLAPLARVTPKATIGSSNRRVKVRGSAAPSTIGPEFVEPHLAAAGQRDRQRREIGDAVRAGERADRLLLAGDLAAAAAEIDVVGADLLVDRRGGDAEREQLLRIERDADLAVDAAEALHLADAVDALQVARDRVVDEPGELLDRHAGRGGRVGDDRQAFDVDAADDRLVDGARQVAADLGDLVLHVVERAVDVDRADVELHDRRRRAVGDGRDDVPDAVEAGDGVLDLLRHLRFELARRGARLGDQHLDDRNVDVGKAGDRHRPEADEPEDRQHRKGDHRRDGSPDRPGGDVEAHRISPPRRSLRPASAAPGRPDAGRRRPSRPRFRPRRARP